MTPTATVTSTATVTVTTATTHPAERVVPGLVGQTRQAADQALTAADLQADFVLVDSDTPADQVVATTPAAGATVAPQSTIQVAISRGPFVGAWVNDDPNTPSIPQVTLDPASGGTLTLHVWGACHPDWCDWGTTTATLAGSQLQASYDAGFATMDLQLTRSGSQLVISMHTHFTDNSGRADYDSTDTMNRK